jgi:hypothetical protein
MKRCSWMMIAVGVLVVTVAPAVADTLLLADFAGMTAGQPVGLGGPTLGEPDLNENCVSTIRDAPFPTTCLEMDDEAAFGTGGVHFSFLENAEVTTGPVEIAVKLWFAESDNYYLYVREPSHAASAFNNLDFTADGTVIAGDAAGSAGTIGTYATGRAIELIIVHDLDAGTYDIWWDGALVVDDRAHGVVGAGVGGVYIGIGHDSDLDGLFYMDDLLITTGPLTPTESRTWGAVKSTWR